MEKVGGPAKTGKSGGTGKTTGQTKTDRANDRAMQTKIASHKNTNTGQTAKQGEASRTQINHSPKDAKVAQSGSKTPLADHLITQKKSDQTKSDQTTGDNSAKAGVQNQMSDQQALDTLQRHSNRGKNQEVAQVQTQAQVQSQAQVQAASGQEQQAQAMPQPLPIDGGQQAPKTGVPQGQPNPTITEPPRSPLVGANDNKIPAGQNSPRVAGVSTKLGLVGAYLSMYLPSQEEARTIAKINTERDLGHINPRDETEKGIFKKAHNDLSSHYEAKYWDNLKNPFGLFGSDEVSKTYENDMVKWADHNIQKHRDDLAVQQAGKDKEPDLLQAPKKPEQGISYTPDQADLVNSLKAQGKSNAEIQREIENLGGGKSDTQKADNISQTDLPPEGTILDKGQRLKIYTQKLTAAPAPQNADEALTLLTKTMDSVEDAYSGVAKKENPGLKYEGRMYAPRADYTTRLPDGSIRAETKGNIIEIEADGTIHFFQKNPDRSKGREVFTKAGQSRN